MKYQRKITEVEAFQLTAETYHDNTDWPAWAQEAWNKGAQELGALYQGKGQPNLYINSNSGPQLVSVNDWIAVGPDGVELYPITDEAFRKLYAVTDEAFRKLYAVTYEDTFRVSLTIDAINGLEHVIKQLSADRDAALVHSAVRAALKTVLDKDINDVHKSITTMLKQLDAE